MMRFVALLRAVNVGGRTVTMDRLRVLFAELGLERVTTVIASGNVLFDARSKNGAALEGRIETYLERTLGYQVATFVRTPAELSAVAAHPAFPPRALSAPGSRLFVAFLKSVPTAAAVKKALALQAETDSLVVRGREVYWLCRVPSNESALSGGALEKTLGQPATVRNIRTVVKLSRG
ncbi:MAG TPA: DUF1697 domain-containing protein [Vicinamibacterales bacterium]|nr:DUF1697 domain-containing protein [Vicinamibacterales bacterium]